jgi:hypothetical protein
MQPFLAMIVPVSNAGGDRPDNSLPGYHPGHPVDPGWGGGWGGGAVDPGFGRPIFHPGHPDHGLPSQPGHPGNRPPGSWGGRPDRPDNSLPGQGGHPWLPGHGDGGLRPDQGLPPGLAPKTPYGSAVALEPPATVDTTEGAWVLVNVQGTMVWAWAQKPSDGEPEPVPDPH